MKTLPNYIKNNIDDNIENYTEFNTKNYNNCFMILNSWEKNIKTIK
jgi:hypothetical protein